MGIHKTAVIEDGAVIGKNVEIGPFCYIGGKVRIGDGCMLKSHVSIEGDTTIGTNCKIYPFAAIGYEPQDLKFEGEESRTIIGNNNMIREYVTIQAGTKRGTMETIVGNNCLLMVSSHVAHDCIIGDNVIVANNVAIAGHVTIGHNAVIGGNSAIHQFVKIGKFAMIGGMSGIEKDVIPFGIAYSERATLNGVNLVGLKRGNFESDDIRKVAKFYKEIFASNEGAFNDRIEELDKEIASSPLVKDIIEFIKNSERGILSSSGSN